MNNDPLPPSTYVLAGATGLIGRRVARALVERGDRVVALVRDPERARSLLPEHARAVRWSATDRDGPWRTELDGADGIINLSGEQIVARWTEGRWRRIRESRVDATRNLVDALNDVDRRPRVLVNGSAVGYYGANPSGDLTERSPAGTDTLGTLCAEWEAEAVHAEAFGVRVVRLRTGLVLAESGGALEPIVRMFRLFIGGPLGSGRQAFPWIHVTDEVGLILWALDNPDIAGPLNAVAPGIVSNREFSRVLGRVLGRPSLLPAPAPALRLLYGRAADALLGGQWVLPDVAITGGYRYAFPDLEAALRRLLC